ncbi:MAG: hypothetical protein ACR2KW_02770 [Rubrobacter sp.]
MLALPVIAAVCVLPGYFWTKLLWAVNKTGGGRTERLAFSVALSLALVPAFSLALARLSGGGVTTLISVLSVLAVFALGFAAHRIFGVPARSQEEVSPSLPALGRPSLALVAVAFAVVLALDFIFFEAFWAATSCWGWGGPDCETSGEVQKLMIPVASALTLAGAAYLWRSRKSRSEEGSSCSESHDRQVEADEATQTPPRPVGWRRFLLPVVLLATLIRGYSGVVLYDWPFIRGVDHYSHAVMSNRMMFEGRIEPYLIYPPGFQLVVADISRISGLDPLEIYPILGPALTVLPALALYALAKSIWGWQVGVAAAFFGGLVIGGPYYYLNDSMYPNLVASQFLLVLSVAALVRLYAAPSWRSGALFAVLGSSVVLYHSVAGLYLGLLLAAVSVVILPYLLLRHRRTGVTLFLSLAALSVIAFLYAWDTYDLPRTIYAALGFGEAAGTTAAVDMAIGTQNPFGFDYLLGTIVSQPVSWLALLGIVLAVGDIVAGTGLRGGTFTVRSLACLTVLLWSLVILVGSSTSLSGFPQRFGRDLGVPLAVFAAFALISLLHSLPRSPLPRSPLPRSVPRLTALWSVGGLAMLAVVLIGSLTTLRVVQGFEQAATPSGRLTTTPAISAAGAWLEENNTGGNIMVGPERTQVPSRMMLAMGNYSALQSFTELNIKRNRDLPPTGPEPLEDVLRVMEEPGSPEAASILEKYDVRYVVIFKSLPDREVRVYWSLFDAYPELYDTVFENPDVVIFAPREDPIALSSP